MFMTDPVPMFDLSRQYECLQKELESAAVDVLRSTVYVGGKEVEALEREIAERIGARGVVALSSGTDALLVALMAHCVGPGDLVAVPTYSFFATAGVVVRLGARPVFVDIDPVTCNITPETLDAAMAPYADQGKLRAVIPVHLYGLCADIEALRAAAAKYGEDVGILEDAAQAIDAQFADGTFAGTKGLAGCFSTYPTKNLGGLGDGGFLSFEDEDYGGRVRAMRNHGQTDQYRHELIGGNFRMDALQAALLRVKLRHLSTMTERRKANAARYRELFQDLDQAGSVRLPPDVAGHCYHQFVVHLPEGTRDQVKNDLREQGIGTAIYYPLPFHLQPCFQHLGGREGDLPNAEAASRTSLALPIFPELRDDEIVRVAEALVRAVRAVPAA
jgi:dTDP-4-amino-4,6-dideoxygalactose transaminase